MLRHESRARFFRLGLQAAGKYSYNFLKDKDFTIGSGARPERHRKARAAKTTNCTIVQRLFSPQYFFIPTTPWYYGK